jgi:hypothetical protein
MEKCLRLCVLMRCTSRRVVEKQCASMCKDHVEMIKAEVISNRQCTYRLLLSVCCEDVLAKFNFRLEGFLKQCF